MFGLVCAVATALVAERCAYRRVLDVHPFGSTPSPYGYVEFVPERPGPRPLVIVLHGSGSRGDGENPGVLAERLPPLRDVARARLFGVRSLLAEEGALVVAPQSPGAWDAKKLDRFLDYLLAARDVDRDRVYLTGLSMGGCGAWEYASAHGERLAAVLPICGGCSATEPLGPGFEKLPVRAIHAFDDDVVPVWMTGKWVTAIAKRRGSDGGDPVASYPKGSDATAVFDGARFSWRPGTAIAANESFTLTELARGGHAIWRDVYAEDATWRWLFAQRKVREPAPGAVTPSNGHGPFPPGVARPRMMIVGDSISAGPGCYKKYLVENLVKGGITNYEFVGAYADDCGGGVRHSAVSCSTTQNYTQESFTVPKCFGNRSFPGMAPLVRAYAPDLVMIELGVNDVWGGNAPIAPILANYTTLVNQARAQNPRIVVVVAQIQKIISDDCMNAKSTNNAKELVAAVPGWARAVSTPESPVFVADLWTDSDPHEADDCVHPNEAGARRMGNNWYHALEGILK